MNSIGCMTVRNEEIGQLATRTRDVAPRAAPEHTSRASTVASRVTGVISRASRPVQRQMNSVSRLGLARWMFVDRPAIRLCRLDERRDDLPAPIAVHPQHAVARPTAGHVGERSSARGRAAAASPSNVSSIERAAGRPRLERARACRSRGAGPRRRWRRARRAGPPLPCSAWSSRSCAPARAVRAGSPTARCRACGSSPTVGSSRKMHARLVDQRARDHQALLLAAGQLVDFRVRRSAIANCSSSARARRPACRGMPK